MFNILSALEKEIPIMIHEVVATPVAALTGGISIFAASLLLVWITYRSYLIMAGMVAEPFLPLMKDFLIKSLIVMIAGSSSYYSAIAANQDSYLISTMEQMSESFTPEGTTSIFGTLEEKFNELTLLMEAIGGAPPQDNEALIDEYGEDTVLKPLFKLMSKFDDFATNTSESISGVKAILVMSIKLTIIVIGLFVFGLCAFVALIINKFFFYLGISVGPLFILAAAFDQTRGWFNSWLNHTLGYGFTYPVIMVVLSGLMKIFDNYFNLGNGKELTFATSIICCLLCVILALMISRIGDLASSFFSAGNISDGVKAVFAAAGYESGGYVNKRSVGAASGTYKIGRSAYNKFRKPKIENDS